VLAHRHASEIAAAATGTAIVTIAVAITIPIAATPPRAASDVLGRSVAEQVLFVASAVVPSAAREQPQAATCDRDRATRPPDPYLHAASLMLY
jgi:hypothetical protein